MNKLLIIFKLEKEIFYLFSLLNLVGYNIENSPRGMHPLRKFIRKRIKKTIEIKQYLLIKKYFSEKHQGQFVQWLLRKKYNPNQLNDLYSKKELYFFKSFDKSFRKFIIKEKNKLFWPEVRKIYLLEKEKHAKKIIKELKNLAKDLNFDFTLLNLNKIIIMPNFLDAYRYGYETSVGNFSFIIYGPLENNDFRLIRHEFLHSVIGPVVSNNKIFNKKIKEHFKKKKIEQKLKKVGYSNWAVLIEEYLIRAIDIKMHNLKKEEIKLLKREKEKGFKYIKRFYKELKENYKKNELLDIFNNILDNIDSVVL